MKKYTNIPLKERERNSDRVYRHEERLEEIWRKRLSSTKRDKHKSCQSDKERECDEMLSRNETAAVLFGPIAIEEV